MKDRIKMYDRAIAELSQLQLKQNELSHKTNVTRVVAETILVGVIVACFLILCNSLA